MKTEGEESTREAKMPDLPTHKVRQIDIGKLSVVTIPVHLLTVFTLKKWTIKKLDKIRKSFL